MKKIISLSLAILLVFSLCACGSQKSAVTSEAYPEPYYEYSGNGLASYGYESMAVAEEAPAAVADAAYSRADDSVSSDAPKENPDKIIYSADVTIESTDFDSSLEGLNKLIEETGGYVESSSINSASYSTISSGAKYSRSASYSIRVPADKFHSLMTSLSDLGNVPSSHVYTDNVTSQYYDTQARLSSYKAQEQRLIELLDMAETVSDVMEIEGELSNVRYKIESLQTSLNSWDKQVSYSTVYLTLKEVGKYTPEAKAGFGTKLAEAFSDGFELLQDFILWLASALPVLIVIGLIAWGVIALIKKNSGKRKEKREAKKAKKLEKKESEQKAEEKD